ncbi:MAG: tRNA pseudouridine(38-40) synthase TruA [Proteobacteria bacterium]|nr:tRNA pseudouridine(38-40) synthase TruA [Pseudomonadota bacterium]
MPRYKLLLEYDGTTLVGWQRQAQGVSVQSLLEDAFEKLGEKGAFVQGAGRTDAGVHATGQVGHVDLAKEWDPWRLCGGLNAHLKHAPVSVLDAQLVDEDFHARFSATSRSYMYRLVVRSSPLVLDAHRAWRLPPPFDVALMQEAAQVLLGTHDFTSFRASECQATSPVRTLDRLDVTEEGGDVRFFIEARSFLHHQVRNFVGTLQLVARGRMTVAQFTDVLEAKDRRRAGPTAPACGLTLTGVGY